MNDARTELAELARAATGMRTGNHGRYLQELLRWHRHASIRRPVRAAASVEFLSSLRGTPYASRTDELSALDDVLQWLSTSLSGDPAMSSEDLAWRIGWLSRLARPIDSSDTISPPGVGGQPRSERHRGDWGNLARAPLGSHRRQARPEVKPAQATAPRSPLPPRGQVVVCKLKGLSKKGKWRVAVVGRDAEGVLDPSGVTADLVEGQEVSLVVDSSSVSADWAFKWPKAT